MVDDGSVDDGAEFVPPTTEAEDRSGPLPAGTSALGVARAASVSVGDEATARTVAGGVTLGVAADYFERAAFQGWQAPEHCSFSTTVSVFVDNNEIVLESPPLNAPGGNSAPAARGELGVAIPHVRTEAGELSSLLVVVVVFDHGTVATLRLPEGAATNASDTQPVDSWTPLAIQVPLASPSVGTDDGGGPASVSVEVNYLSQDGTSEVASLTVPVDLGANLLMNLTDEWAFDDEMVDASCIPPAAVGDVPVNQPWDPEQGRNGAVLRAKPDLPEPGEQPADAEAATAEALHAIRTVYDIFNLYDPAKYDFMDDPVKAAEVFQEAERLSVVEPFVGALNPLFDSMVFTSPTEGTVLYRVGDGYSWEMGRVLLVDGTWRVALGTLCRDISDAMYTCPGVVQDPRPGPLG